SRDRSRLVATIWRFAVPPLPATGLPADLVRRRPDVDQAHLRLKAADADTAAAVSNQYPRLTLSASLSTSNDAGSDLFTDWARSFSGSLVAPLLDAGRRQAEVDRSQAVKKQRLYQYGQAVLTAFQEVEDALVREKKQVQQIESIEARVRLAERTYRQLRTEYINGAADFIDVLTALTEAQQLRRELISARRERMEIRIGLYRAVAGGFETPMTAEQKP
ncbi:MAG: TolC family protein, partial [Thermodesulfobacteriota bacterium]